MGSKMFQQFGGLAGSGEMNVTNERRYVVRVLKLI